MKLFDQDLCNNLRYELNPRVRCAFGNVSSWDRPLHKLIDSEYSEHSNEMNITLIGEVSPIDSLTASLIETIVCKRYLPRYVDEPVAQASTSHHHYYRFCCLL